MGFFPGGSGGLSAILVSSFLSFTLFYCLSFLATCVLHHLSAHFFILSSRLNLNACNQITNAGLAHLANSKRLFSVREIELNDCERIDIDGLKTLANAKG